LGNDGHLVGVDYSIDMWPEFGGFANAEFIEKKKTWAAEWVEGAKAWQAGTTGELSAFTFGGRDMAMDGKVDAVLFIRAMHNVSRFEAKGGYMTQALADTHALLKPGGIVGVVQHQGPESNTDEWAVGSSGYLKKSNVIAAFEAAGFELVKESAINENPKDVPTNDDIRTVSTASICALKAGSSARKASMRFTACMTVVWSRPPKRRPISGRERLVSFFDRYMATWRGRAIMRARRFDVISVRVTRNSSQTAFWMRSTVRRCPVV